jgi:hypothetical protein
MTIHEFSSFYNESILAQLKIEENKKWVDKFHITESNRDFRFRKKDFNFNIDNDSVKHYKLNGTLFFQRPHFRISRSKFLLRKVELDPWKNDKIQRNFAISKFKPNDDDIIIVSDIDEVLDSRMSNELISYVHQNGIITVGLHYTLYFFNLFSENWYGPPNYSYRVFLMTGEYFKKMQMDSDTLRKMGERGDLINKIRCFPEIAGFHHSWLGDEKFLLQKLKAYPHAQSEHDSSIYDKNNEPDSLKLKELLLLGKSIYGAEHKLKIRNDISPLEFVEANRNSIYRDLFL